MFLLIYINIWLVLLFILLASLNVSDNIILVVGLISLFMVSSLLFSFIYFLIELVWERKNFVPFVPTWKKVAFKMIELANLENKEKVYDLGCWDGLILFLAAKKYNCEFIWIEKKIDVYLIAKIRSFFYPNVHIKKADFFKEDISDADVIFVYLFPEIIKNLEEKITKECKEETLIVSHGFEFEKLHQISFNKIKKQKIVVYDNKKI